MPEPIPMTAENLARLRSEIETLKTQERAKIRADLAHARSFGDFNENAELDEAKRAHSALEGRIRQLEAILGRAQVVESSCASEISVDTKVTALDLQANEEIHFIIGLNGLSDSDAILVTPDSPMGRALIGKCVNDTIEVEAPGGSHKLQITAITFSAGSGA
ncbi:MAG: transcription elongation factor GreA [Armatimonadetes bacterium]|nr:transcription elongation factor GreA [Armatimonadota bacterium]NIM24730.1 transcription elongation factor GreA [Armatimonadota bacterium]NIM68610.1 transcription elongation factor GreA [Armatimonadota bacterium]NIM77127.1 transcription elongation factor GreA [Armatimonadota bacterium]NIN06804.1 transcription elongation factor GreA [Armatimonadota bacterium]